MLYSVPLTSMRYLVDGISKHPGHLALPTECHELSKFINYVGDEQPKMATNWRLAESVSALKGFEAIMLNLLLKHAVLLFI